MLAELIFPDKTVQASLSQKLRVGEYFYLDRILYLVVSITNQAKADPISGGTGYSIKKQIRLQVVDL